MSIPYQTCIHCKEFASLHGSEAASCPIMKDGKRVGWHPTNRFTPAIQAASIKCPHCQGVHGASDPCFASALSACPPGCAPFDLAKALAGEECVTRLGKPATGLRYCPYGDRKGECFIAVVGDQDVHCEPDGKRYGSNSPHPDDLFLAAKESQECNGCRGSGQAVGGKCPDCHGSGKASPPPETEAPRAEENAVECLKCHTLPNQTESKSAGMFWLTCVQCEEETASRETLAEAIAEWNEMNHPRPASPAPPRIIHVVNNGAFMKVTTPEQHDFGLSKKFIDLNQLLAIAPEVRAKLGMGGEK